MKKRIITLLLAAAVLLGLASCGSGGNIPQDPGSKSAETSELSAGEQTADKTEETESSQMSGGKEWKTDNPDGGESGTPTEKSENTSSVGEESDTESKQGSTAIELPKIPINK